jgi:hypothetical protein
MKKLIFAAVAISGLAGPALAEDTVVGVGVGPVRAGVVTGDHDRDRATVIKEREPSRKVIIRKDDDGTRTKTIIRQHDDD